MVKDKEWWQNSEVLVGYLDVYEKLGKEKYIEAFLKTWEFDKKYFINNDIGEWHQLLSQEGKVIIGDVGNQWKCFYHSGRSMMECIQRLKKLIHENKK